MDLSNILLKSKRMMGRIYKRFTLPKIQSISVCWECQQWHFQQVKNKENLTLSGPLSVCLSGCLFISGYTYLHRCSESSPWSTIRIINLYSTKTGRISGFKQKKPKKNTTTLSSLNQCKTSHEHWLNGWEVSPKITTTSTTIKNKNHH